MEGLADGPLSHVLEPRSEVFEHVPVGVLDVPIRPEERDDRWKAIDDQPIPILEQCRNVLEHCIDDAAELVVHCVLSRRHPPSVEHAPLPSRRLSILWSRFAGDTFVQWRPLAVLV